MLQLQSLSSPNPSIYVNGFGNGMSVSNYVCPISLIWGIIIYKRSNPHMNLSPFLFWLEPRRNHPIILHRPMIIEKLLRAVVQGREGPVLTPLSIEIIWKAYISDTSLLCVHLRINVSSGTPTLSLCQSHQISFIILAYYTSHFESVSLLNLCHLKYSC